MKDEAHKSLKLLDSQVDQMLDVYTQLTDDREMKKRLVTAL